MKVIQHSQSEPFVTKINDLDFPVILVCFPFNFNNTIKNNVYMEDAIIDYKLAYKQFINFYQQISQCSLVYVLPYGAHFQDLVYVANIGFMVPSNIKNNTIIISNFRSTPRAGEELIGANFFSAMGLNTLRCPYFFEGEADLKYIKDNLAIGGYNLRTDINAHRWIEQNCGMKIISVKMNDDYLYHLDCSVFVLDGENILAYVDDFSFEDIKEIEKHVNIIPIKNRYDAVKGSSNSVRLGKSIFNSSNINTLSKLDHIYQDEKNRIDYLASVCSRLNLELNPVDLSEFFKSGAALSCCVMRLNYIGYNQVELNQ